ncbi:hypothetical protein OS493_006579 [Desmophyllum pertusum]|uniref:Uncharacterized protein n=1 Tax=Desmophyllum pertusum TaxID=174260 RepID=A0A9X0A8N1_9CNID|nr:hypothetical protein OS493_006579 [Desmophyllum pertusum]
MQGHVPNTQKQTIPDVPVASSYLQIVDDNSTILAISSSKHPAKDAKDQVKGRIYITLSSPENADPEALEDSADPMQDNGNICGKNEPNTQQVNSKENRISEGAKKSFVDKPECVVLIDENREQSGEFYTEVPILMNSQCHEQQNGRTSQDVDKNKENGGITDGKKLPNENDHGCTAVFHSEESSALSAGTEKVIPRHGDESERVFPIQIRPIVKRRRKKKRSTGIHSDGKNKADKRVSPQDNVSTQSVEKLDKTGPDNVTDFKQTKSNGISNNEDKDDDEYQIVNYAEHVANKAGTDVPVTPEYHAGVTSENQAGVTPEYHAGVSPENQAGVTPKYAEAISESGTKIKPGDQDKYIYDYAAPQGVTDRRSSDIVSQLRTYLQERMRETQHVNRVKKTTAGPEVTKSYSEDTYLTVGQENEAHAKEAGQENHPTTTEQDRLNTTTEPIYANINDINANYCQTHAGADAHPEVTYVNQGNIQNGRDEYSDSFPIYANISEVLHRSTMCNGNAALRNEHRFPNYDNNDVIDV